MNQPRRAVITGPTGAVGIALTEALAESGCEVYVVCRPDSARLDRVPKRPNVHTVLCPLNELSRLTSFLTGADAFFHLGWENTYGAAGRNDLESQLRNVSFTLDAVRAAKTLGCTVFLGAGSQAEYGRSDGLLTPSSACFPENGYGAAKLCAGQMSRIEARRLGIRHVWTRIFSVYGPGDRDQTLVMSVIRALLRGESPACTDCAQIWDYLFSRDAANALAALSERGKDGAVYPVASGRSLPLKTYVEAIRAELAPDLSVHYGAVAYAPLQVTHLEADISALEADTGYRPTTDFSDGIRQTIAWIKEQTQNG